MSATILLIYFLVYLTFHFPLDLMGRSQAVEEAWVLGAPRLQQGGTHNLVAVLVAI